MLKLIRNYITPNGFAVRDRKFCQSFAQVADKLTYYLLNIFIPDFFCISNTVNFYCPQPITFAILLCKLFRYVLATKFWTPSMLLMSTDFVGPQARLIMLFSDAFSKASLIMFFSIFIFANSLRLGKKFRINFYASSWLVFKISQLNHFLFCQVLVSIFCSQFSTETDIEGVYKRNWDL